MTLDEITEEAKKLSEREKLRLLFLLIEKDKEGYFPCKTSGDIENIFVRHFIQKEFRPAKKDEWIRFGDYALYRKEDQNEDIDRIILESKFDDSDYKK